MVLPIRSVEAALARLGYSEDERAVIAAHVAEGGDLDSAPYFRSEHLAIFATAVGGNAISPMGHIKMMGAVQPFLSGAISKTVNLPEETTVAEVEATYIAAWKQGIKAVALYRDNSKVAQPLSASKGAAVSIATSDEEVWEVLAGEAREKNSILVQRVAVLEAELATPRAVAPARRRLPRHRRSRTYAFQVGEAEGYVTVGEYDDGGPGELFAKVSKQGSTLAGVMDAFSIAISLGLQHGVPLETYVRKFTNMRFEPAGMTDDPELRIATSLVDYIFRRLAIDYLDADVRGDLGIRTSCERTAMVQMKGEIGEVDQEPFAPDSASAQPALERGETGRGHGAVDAPLCYQCGTPMLRTGSCFACPSCGQTSGCS